MIFSDGSYHFRGSYYVYHWVSQLQASLTLTYGPGGEQSVGRYVVPLQGDGSQRDVAQGQSVRGFLRASGFDIVMFLFQ